MWPIDRVRRRLLHKDPLPEALLREQTLSRAVTNTSLPTRPQPTHTPILLTHIDRDRTLIAACCERARSAGIVHAMPLAEARALLRQAPHVEPFSPDADARGLIRLARWAYRYVPRVAIDGTDGLLLDATGCERMYAGIDRLLRVLAGKLVRAGIGIRLAAAPTFGAAWAVAHFGSHNLTLVRQPELATVLGGLPIAALRLSALTLDALRAVGVERISELRALPRASIAARYGSETLLRLDQAMGSAIESIDAVQPKWPIRVERLFDGPTDRLDSITLAANGLVEMLATELTAKHRGTLSLRVELIRSDLEPVFILIRTSRPCAEPRHIWKLLAPKIENAHLGFGVEGVRLLVLCSGQLRDTQGKCWADDEAHPPERSRLLDTLAARLMPERVLRPMLLESHVPERAVALRPALSLPAIAPPAFGPTALGLQTNKPLRPAHHKRPNPLSPTSTAPGYPGMLERPTSLLSEPLPITVTLLLPDGPLVMFGSASRGGASHRVIACHGPERIAGEWWRHSASSPTRTVTMQCESGGAVATARTRERDYFRVQTDDGRWVWIFRESALKTQSAQNGPAGSSDRWFIHGEWA